MLVKVQGTSEQVIAIAAKAEGPKGVGDVTHEMSANTPILTFPPRGERVVGDRFLVFTSHRTT